MLDAELVEEIRQVITASGFHREGYRKLRARLRYEEISSLAGAGFATHARERLARQAMPKDAAWPSGS